MFYSKSLPKANTYKDRILTFFEGQLMWHLNDEDAKDLVGENIYEAFSHKYKKLDLENYMRPIEDILDGNLKEHYSEHHIESVDRWFRTRFVPILGKRVHNSIVDSGYVDVSINPTRPILCVDFLLIYVAGPCARSVWRTTLISRFITDLSSY